MFISILAAGSRGDTQPYIALGVALKKAGHHVRLASHENYSNFVIENELDFFPIKGDVSLILSDESLDHAKKADNPLKVLLSFNKLRKMVMDLQEGFFQACMGADCIVYHPGVTVGYFAANYMRIPAVLATPFPMTATRDFPALLFYDSMRLGRNFNFLTHKIFEQIMWSGSSSAVSQFWIRKFGKKPEDFGSPFTKQNRKAYPTIISNSNFVFPRPKDWSEHIHSDGFWFLDEEKNWKPSDALIEFLDQGVPPIYIGFGSVGDPKSAAQTTQLAINALLQSGQRGILATGWSGMSRMEKVPDNVFILENAPHSWLFPRMAAVVHHGGAGTTAAGLRAGVPGIIIPHSNDQFAWARRVYELGVGSKPISRKNLTVERLAEAIGFVLKSDIRKSAKDLGKKIQTENGIEAAVRVIDSLEMQK